MIMELFEVNEDANYKIQLYVDGKWQTLTEEYSVSSAIALMSNSAVLTGLKSRVVSKETKTIIGES